MKSFIFASWHDINIFMKAETWNMLDSAGILRRDLDHDNGR